MKKYPARIFFFLFIANLIFSLYHKELYYGHKNRGKEKYMITKKTATSTIVYSSRAFSNAPLDYEEAKEWLFCVMMIYSLIVIFFYRNLKALYLLRFYRFDTHLLSNKIKRLNFSKLSGKINKDITKKIKEEEEKKERLKKGCIYDFYDPKEKEY